MSPVILTVQKGLSAMRRAGLSLLAHCLVLALAAPSGALAQGGPSLVRTDLVERREVAETVSVFGQVVATRESEVAVRVSGVVTEVRVETGAQVEEGAVLAVLDRELLQLELRSKQAALSEAEAGIEVAQAGLTLAERGFARVEGLRGTNAFSQGQFEDREGALARARGELAQAEARLLNAEAAADRAAYDLERAELRAPFGGTVLEVMVDPGEYVQTGAPVARLLDIHDLEIEANVPAEYVPAMAPGMVIDAALADGQPLQLTVRALLPTEYTATRTRPVRFTADLAALGNRVAVGQSLTLNAPRDVPRTLLLVPKDAVTQARGAWSVFVHEDGKAVPRTIEIGASFGAHFEVLSGLSEGDEVVVRGNERLRPMQDIAPEPVPAREGAAGTPDPNRPDAQADADRTRRAGLSAQ
ncbi:efflux RND transporter periplasmic adaptor subunit [Meridianimarinicoccus roseus]|uniref:Efflux RND transporter periplasmic adaptor subunit n=2 Tax=Meridianimarinicoccus roseus TaxID=2072018 RepID=A0A2V2LAW4_9RHOB|nr:efflux RND transporter periplasmic adaptor subunit [Meridianimarinicoccus roseus]